MFVNFNVIAQLFSILVRWKYCSKYIREGWWEKNVCVWNKWLARKINNIWVTSHFLLFIRLEWYVWFSVGFLHKAKTSTFLLSAEIAVWFNLQITVPCCLGLGQVTFHPGTVTLVILNPVESEHFSSLQNSLSCQVEISSPVYLFI